MRQHRTTTLGRRVERTFAGAICALVMGGVAACPDSESNSGQITSEQAMADAAAVFEADLASGGTGESASRLVQRWIRMEGVDATRSDSGQHVWVYSVSDPTSAQIAEIRDTLSNSLMVDNVRRTR